MSIHAHVYCLQENREELVHAEVKDTGKPIWEVRFDMDGCADSVEYYAGLAATIAGKFKKNSVLSSVLANMTSKLCILTGWCRSRQSIGSHGSLSKLSHVS